MTDTARLKRAWWALVTLTLASAVVAESSEPAVWTVLLICLTVAVKGQLVIDRLMGLRCASPRIRWVMLSYFYLLPLTIALALLFPAAVERLTTL